MKALPVLLSVYCFVLLTAGAIAAEVKQEDKKKAPRLESLSLIVFATAKNPNWEEYDRLLRAIGGEMRGPGHEVKQVGLADPKDGRFKGIVVRRFPADRPLEIMIIAGVGDQGYVYMTSVDGVLRKAFFKTNGDPGSPIALSEAQEPFEQELAWWKEWEERQNRDKKD